MTYHLPHGSIGVRTYCEAGADLATPPLAYRIYDSAGKVTHVWREGGWCRVNETKPTVAASGAESVTRSKTNQ
jgi:hypothetical protein